MRFAYPFYAILVIVVVQVLFLWTGMYTLLPDIDNVMHFSGGFAMGLLAIALHHDMTDKHDIKNHPLWYHFLFVIGFTMLIGVAWEFHEYIVDNTFAVWYDWPKSQLDLADTMLDLVMDGLGGTVAFLSFRKRL